ATDFSTCEAQPIDVLADALCDVRPPAVTFTTARIGITSADFDSTNRATLNLSSGTSTDQICHDRSSFNCIVSFTLPDDARALSEERSSVVPIDTDNHPPNHDWFINSANFENVNLTTTPKSGQLVINMQR